MISSSCELWHCVNIGAALWRHSTAQRSRLVWLRPPVTLSTTTGTVEPSITTGSSAICSSVNDCGTRREWGWSEWFLVIIVDFLSSVSLWRRARKRKSRNRNTVRSADTEWRDIIIMAVSTPEHNTKNVNRQSSSTLSLYCARHVTHLHDSAGIYESNVDWGETKKTTYIALRWVRWRQERCQGIDHFKWTGELFSLLCRHYGQITSI